MPKTIKVDGQSAPEASVVQAVKDCLERGVPIVLPTETVYGVGVDPSVEGAMDNLYEAKQRPEDKQIPIMVAGLGAVQKHAGVELPEQAAILAEAFWPGPLTMVLDTADGTTGYRIPAHTFTLGLLQETGGILAVTSANISGRDPALTAEDALDQLGDAVGVVLDAGPSEQGIASTVISLAGGGCEILRIGGIPEDAIRGMIQR